MGCETRVYRTRWHPVKLGRVGLLHKGHALGADDGLQSRGAVRPRARKDDANCILALIFAKRRQESVDGHALPARNHRGAQLQFAALDHHHAIRWDDVDVIGLNRDLIHRLRHGHDRGALQNFSQGAVIVRIHVGYQHEGHPDICRGIAEELLKCFQPARRSADTDDGKVQLDDLASARFGRRATQFFGGGGSHGFAH